MLYEKVMTLKEAPPMANFETLGRQLARQTKAYFSAPVGDFYAVGANRLMLYPFMTVFFLLECAAFWAIFYGPAFMLEYMAFSTVYSLHKAALFTLCLLGADVLANRLVPAWGAYKKRTVGRQWIIWTMGLIVGVVALRTVVNGLIVFYAPEVVNYLMANPEARLGLYTILLILFPVWAVMVFLTLQIAKSKNQIKRLASAVLVVPEDRPKDALLHPKPNGRLPAGSLKLDSDNGNRAINLADVTHVTVEDHYCRVHYLAGNRPKSIMIRLPLKEMMLKLPREHFLQTHRSHVINMGHASHLAKDGREYKVVLRGLDVELPVSRHRFKKLEPRLTMTRGISPITSS